MKTRHCEDCKHADFRPIGEMICERGHKPRFYMPKSCVDSQWGYKKKCPDFKQGKAKTLNV